MNRADVQVPVDRSDAANKLLDLICQRFLPNPSKDERLSCPLIAAQAISGGGKSFFLDQLASLRGKFPGSRWASPNPPPVVKYLDQAVYVNITFNGGQPGPVTPETAEFSVAIRTLYS